MKILFYDFVWRNVLTNTLCARVYHGSLRECACVCVCVCCARKRIVICSCIWSVCRHQSKMCAACDGMLMCALAAVLVQWQWSSIRTKQTNGRRRTNRETIDNGEFTKYVPFRLRHCHSNTTIQTTADDNNTPHRWAHIHRFDNPINFVFAPDFLGSKWHQPTNSVKCADHRWTGRVHIAIHRHIHVESPIQRKLIATCTTPWPSLDAINTHFHSLNLFSAARLWLMCCYRRYCCCCCWINV